MDTSMIRSFDLHVREPDGPPPLIPLEWADNPQHIDQHIESPRHESSTSLPPDGTDARTSADSSRTDFRRTMKPSRSKGVLLLTGWPLDTVLEHDS